MSMYSRPILAHKSNYKFPVYAIKRKFNFGVWKVKRVKGLIYAYVLQLEVFNICAKIFATWTFLSHQGHWLPLQFSALEKQSYCPITQHKLS